MQKLTKYFLIFHTAMLLITGFGIWIIIKLFFPVMMVRGYFIIPLFFYLLGIIFILRFSKTPLDKPANIVNVYMLMRMIKIFVSFAVILIYWMVHKENIRNFAIIFIFFYIINLIWETYIYLRMEKYIKYKKDQKKPPRERIDQ
ncbi:MULTISPECIES: hypothetical protein [Proteiniphilum]|uniref:hypothetical protein n=1 Tax=Proteiniphilum TaxID=294702 RepID=UPI001EEA8D03|nr:MULTISPECIES: hypothetical protein [Proteiniphilum]ULB33572.1 hypothetical protein KDN43_11180 [Proteiniphilum propionicum]